MGSLARFDLPKLMHFYGIKHFVETGTGHGQSLALAARLPFKTLRSCEIEPTLANAATAAFFTDDRIKISCDISLVFLDDVCRDTPQDEPILFWLDAHFPGADYQLRGYGSEPDDLVRLPLPAEIEAIVTQRPQCKDVILVDDLRIWIDGPFTSGNLPANVRPYCPQDRNGDFFTTLTEGKYLTNFQYQDEGYVTILPKETIDVGEAVGG
jgi:hypothetical protein